MGGSWASFGRGFGWPGASFGRSWALLGRFLGIQIIAFLNDWLKIGPHGPKMGSKRPSGSILAPFWEGFGRVWRGLGKDLGGFGSSWAHIGKDLGIWSVLGQILEIYRDLERAGTYLDIGPPRWSAKRHNARGPWGRQAARTFFPSHPVPSASL